MDKMFINLVHLNQNDHEIGMRLVLLRCRALLIEMITSRQWLLREIVSFKLFKLS